MISPIQALLEFHAAFKLKQNEFPQIQSKEQMELQVSLIQEELNELKEAHAANDLVEVLDAVCDINYLTMGLVVQNGLQHVFPKAFSEVHYSNMSKLDKEGNPMYNEYGKVIKSENYKAPELQPILEFELENKKRREVFECYLINKDEIDAIVEEKLKQKEQENG